MIRRSLEAGLRLAVALVPGCDCEDFCDDSLVIRFAPETPWSSGTREVDLQVGNETVHCTIRPGWTEECDDDSTIANVEWVSYLGDPERVDITVSFEGQVLAEATFEPSYEKISDWDRACGPPCRNAAVTLDLP